MRCRAARRAIDLRLDERLSLEQGFTLDQHLESCESCRQAWKNALEIEEGLLRMPEAPMAGLQLERSVAAIEARLANTAAPVPPSAAGRYTKRTVVSLAFAAGLLLWGAMYFKAIPQTPVAHQDQTIANASSMHAPVAEEPLIETTPILAREIPMDDSRMAQARAQVRTQLSLAYVDWKTGTTPPEAYALDVEQRTIELRKQSWPVIRISEGLLTDEEITVASAAARYLGLRGNRGSLRRLQRALERNDIQQPVILALSDAGAEGLMALCEGLMIPALRERVSELLLHQQSPLAAQAVADLIARQATEEDHWRDPELVELLIAMGSQSLPALFALGQSETLSFEELCAVLEDIPSSGSYLVSALSSSPVSTRSGSKALRIQVRCAGVFAAHTASRWLQDRLHERTWHDFCIEQLPRLKGVAGVEALVQLDDDPRLGSVELDGLYEQALAIDTGRFLATLEQWKQLHNPVESETLARRMLSLGTAPALPVIRALLKHSSFNEPLVQDLLHFLMRHGEAEDTAIAGIMLAACTEEQQQLAAATLLVLHQLGGEGIVESALVGLSQRQQSNILQLLRRHKSEQRTTPSLYKLARELRPWLRSRALATRNSSS